MKKDDDNNQFSLFPSQENELNWLFHYDRSKCLFEQALEFSEDFFLDGSVRLEVV